METKTVNFFLISRKYFTKTRKSYTQVNRITGRTQQQQLRFQRLEHAKVKNKRPKCARYFTRVLIWTRKGKRDYRDLTGDLGKVNVSRVCELNARIKENIDRQTTLKDVNQLIASWFEGVFISCPFMEMQ